MTYDQIAADEIIDKTIVNLKSHGINAVVVDNAHQAKAKVFELIPEGSEVMTMTSETLRSTKIVDEIDESGKFDSVRAKFAKLTADGDAREKRQLGAAPDYTIGSVHAVTATGEVLVASNTGSQLPAYLYGAGTVVWVVGAQKIVPTLDEAYKRVREYVLPLESVRAHEAYGVEGSFISKLVTFFKEVNPDRIHMIIVKEKLGF